MKLTGQNFIGNTRSAKGKTTFAAVNPQTNEPLSPSFYEATSQEVGQAVEQAEAAFPIYSNKSAGGRAEFLDTVAEEILALGDSLIQRCCTETGLPEARITGERGRTMGQLKLFAQVLREGSWVDARIDTADPERKPIPKPDTRSMLTALGPVGIFGASNFPLAFSVAGGDTASALAAGCPIVVKAHPAHPGTCELIANAIIAAIKKNDMPQGTFAMVQGQSTSVGMAMVNHPLIKAIGFTGSFKGGKAIFDAAAQRPEPIPVYAEMGSTNPVFILPGALAERQAAIADGLTASVTLGVGQFCTNPGLVVLEQSDTASQFQKNTAELFQKARAATMLTAGIQQAYNQGIEQLKQQKGVKCLAEGSTGDSVNQGTPWLFVTPAESFLANAGLEEEVFGPSTLFIMSQTKTELLKVAESLTGHLTATLHATEADLKEYQALIAILKRKAGRLIINGFPTGVEVCHSMVHGGPFPATTDSRTTSVGTAAIARFARPVCYQNFPDDLLPDELKDDNPLQIWRIINGQRER